MDKPGSNEEIQLVAILHRLGKNQKEIAGILHMRNEKVGAIENWLKTESLESVEKIIDDYHLKQVIENKLLKRFEEQESEEGGERHLEPVDLVKAAWVTAEDILQDYRRDDYSPKPPTGPAKDDLVASELYQQHQNSMLQFVERFRSEVQFGPRLCMFQLRNLRGPGPQSEVAVNLGTVVLLFWYVEDNGSVSLNYLWEQPEHTDMHIIWNYFQQHLRSGSYSWLLDDGEKSINKWKQLGGEELKRRTRLLCQIDRKVEKLTNKPLSEANLMKAPGPSYWFSNTICLHVLDGLYDSLDYKVEPINSGLFKVMYGVHFVALTATNFIGLTATHEEGEQYIEWHKNLMAKYAGCSSVAAINRIKKQRLSVEKNIEDTLTKFLVDKHVPGRCNFKFCNYW